MFPFPALQCTCGCVAYKIVFISYFSFPEAVEGLCPPVGSDMAEELSRKLEDILNTYCLEGEDGAQAEPVEAEEVEKGGAESPQNGLPCVEVNGVVHREETKAEVFVEEPKINGSTGEKEQKKLQEKKKAKGLGELCSYSY